MPGFLARVSARRPWTAICVWIVLVAIAAILIRTMLTGATTTELTLSGKAESAVAARLLEERLRGRNPMLELVVIQSGHAHRRYPGVSEQGRVRLRRDPVARKWSCGRWSELLPDQ